MRTLVRSACKFSTSVASLRTVRRAKTAVTRAGLHHQHTPHLLPKTGERPGTDAGVSSCRRLPDIAPYSEPTGNPSDDLTEATKSMARLPNPKVPPFRARADHARRPAPEHGAWLTLVAKTGLDTPRSLAEPARTKPPPETGAVCDAEPGAAEALPGDDEAAA